MNVRILATLLAAVALGSFVLPFFSVSTLGERIPLIDYTGLELLTGTTFQQPLKTGDLPKPLRPVPEAWLVFVGLLIAGIATWSDQRWARAIGATAALIAILASCALPALGYFAITRTIPDHLSAWPLRAVWIPFASAVLLLLCVWPSRPKEKAPADAGA